MIKLLLPLACLVLLAAASIAADSAARGAAAPAAKPEEVRAVMFLVTVDKNSGVWTHAQVIGGYKDHDACTRAVSMARAAALSDLAANDIPIFLCPTIDPAKIQAQQKSGDDSEDAAPPQRRRDIGPLSTTISL
jgi:hypothetical protein